MNNFFKKEEDDDDFDDENPNEAKILPLNIERSLNDDNLITYTPIPINFLNLHDF